VIKATFIDKTIFYYYTKKEEFMQLLFGNFKLATNSLSGNWKPGGITPSAPPILERDWKLLTGSNLTPPVLLESLRD
jgi:hypothetical protein